MFLALYVAPHKSTFFRSFICYFINNIITEVKVVGVFKCYFLQSAVYGNGDVLLHTFENMGREHLPVGLTIQPFSSSDISTITTAQMLRWTITLAAVPAVSITLIAVIVLIRRRNA